MVTVWKLLAILTVIAICILSLTVPGLIFVVLIEAFKIGLVLAIVNTFAKFLFKKSLIDMIKDDY